MATKRTVKKRGSKQRPELERVRKLSRRAQAELTSLLKRHQTGTITRIDLHTGLKEINNGLKKIDLHFYKL